MGQLKQGWRWGWRLFLHHFEHYKHNFHHPGFMNTLMWRIRSKLKMRAVFGLFAITIFNIQAASGTTEETQALLYLQKYGYVENRDGTGALLSEEGIKKQLAKAVRDFQAFAGLNQTGELDPVTVELMGTPRCGVNDIIGHGATARRKKRYPSTARLSKRDVDETTAK